MNPIGSVPNVIPTQTAPSTVTVKVKSDAAPVLPAAPAENPDQAVVDAKAAELRRLETVQRLSEAIANVYVVGDKRFTIFKDITGQYITRFTSLRDGKVTYIPEPELFRLQSGAQQNAPAFLKINA